MKINHSTSLKKIIRLIVLIGIYIFYEINCRKSMGVVTSSAQKLLFYSFDAIYFLCGIRFYLPLVWTKITSDYFRLLAILFFIVIYSISYCLLGILHQFLLHGSVKYGLSFDAVNVASWRGVHITIAVAAYSFLRYTILSMKEVKEQKLLTLEAEKQKLEVEKRMVILENNYLRSIINAHFLFNIFNMQYRKAIMLDEGLASSIKSGADLMKYALHNNQENGSVLLSEDISYMETYIRLQQELHNYNLQVHFRTDIHPSGKDIGIPPLLFLNFVENIFKYAELRNPETPADIHLYYDGTYLKFSTKNRPNVTNDFEGYNIGIANAKARIQQHYSDRSSILITHDKDQFEVEITITL